MIEILNKLEDIRELIESDTFTKNELINKLGDIAKLVNEKEMFITKLEEEKLRQYKRISELEGRLDILYDLIKGAIENL